MSQYEGVGLGREGDCAVRVVLDQDADRHARGSGGAEVGGGAVSSNISNDSWHG